MREGRMERHELETGARARACRALKNMTRSCDLILRIMGSH